jgi:hypothetical protein
MSLRGVDSLVFSLTRYGCGDSHCLRTRMAETSEMLAQMTYDDCGNLSLLTDVIGYRIG